MRKLLVIGLIPLAVLLAQAPAVMTKFAYPANYGGPYEIYSQPMPTTLTSLESRDSHVQQYCIWNPDTASHAPTIRSNDGTPVPFPGSGVAIAAGTSYCFSSPNGTLFRAGFSAQDASGKLIWHIVWTH